MTKTLAELVSAVLAHPDCPGELYNAMTDALDAMQRPGSADTPAWVQSALDRQKEFDAIEAEMEERGH